MSAGAQLRQGRDSAALRRALERWLEHRLPPGAQPRITKLDTPTSNGLSSETVLFETSWTHDAEEQTHTFVARFVPDPAAVPVFPTYDLERQARVMEIVRE